MSLPQLGVKNKDGTLKQVTEYTDGRTKQCYKDECDIQKILARADKAGTMSHLEKFQGVYADYSNVDFHELTNKLTKGREIFDELPAELRKEFGQSPAAFFAYVNDPSNKDELLKKLPGLAAPGRQLNRTRPPTADEEAAVAAASELASKTDVTPLEEEQKPTATADVATSTPLPGAKP